MLAIAIVFIPITVIGIFGNILVLLVIALNTQMHDSTSLFISNLALADLLFLTFCVPVTALSYVSKSWPFSDSVCYITVSLQYITCYVSVWTLVLLAHDRFVSITSSITGRSSRRCKVVFYICITVWLIVLALNSLQMRNVGVLRFEYNGIKGSACVDSLAIALTTASPLQARLFYWGFNLGAYLLPLTLSCAFYFLLVKEIWRQKLVQSKSSQKVKRHATRMVFVVILTFGFCWLPQNFRFFLQGLNYPQASFWEHNEKILLLVQSVVQTMAYANSCVNPILYGLLSERFRIAFRRTISRFLICLCPTLINPSLTPSPASFANNYSLQLHRNSLHPSNNSIKRPSSTINFGGTTTTNLLTEYSNNRDNGWINNKINGLNNSTPSIYSQNSLDEHRKNSQQSLQLLATLNGNKLMTLGEEKIDSSNINEDIEDYNDEDVVLL
uniref:G-protein coupled receptors family 1 profile domain-containing protein n=2 Tax=Meloidogyne TaxID=189290 RepID=A0A6V7UCI9_MELEN|nr:unnamed protein product [Meloidogyne enterolobii]